MEKLSSMIVVGVACGLVLLIAILRRRAQVLLKVLVRLVLGVGAIYLTNNVLAEQGIDLAVGINPISLLTSGTLGFGGVALLYAISACKFL